VEHPIADAFRRLIGLPCWRVERGQGSILSFEFGSPRLFVREPYVSDSSSAKVRQLAARRVVKPIGDWHLFVYCCRWRVTNLDEAIACADNSIEQIEAAASVLDGQKLKAFTLDAPSRRTEFAFDLGSTLSTWPLESNEDEQWSLYLPDKRVLSYRADGAFSVCTEDELPEREVWHEVMKSLSVE